MPSPREIALAVNRAEGFRPGADEGTPQMVPEPREPDYAADPKNPPDGPPPAANLKGD
jgi:hypothetical protein